MIQKKPMLGSITTTCKLLLEALYIKPPGAFFAMPDSAVEVHFDIRLKGIGEESDRLIIPTPY
jgi:hypothetical protein